VVGDLPTGELARAEVDAGREIEVRAVSDGEVGDVPTYRRFGSPIEKSRPMRSGKRRPDWSGTVVFTLRRNRIPASWCSRITRATRL